MIQNTFLPTANKFLTKSLKSGLGLPGLFAILELLIQFQIFCSIVGVLSIFDFIPVTIFWVICHK
jgi:hypothetical protein